MEESTIAVILGHPPKVISIPRDANEFVAGEEHFRELVGGSHIGFYDFLRNPSGSVVGIRFLPSGEAEDVLKEAALEGRNLHFVQDGLLEAFLILLDETLLFDPEISCDQYFGDNRIYRAGLSNQVAISFSLDPLSSEERKSLFESSAQ